MPNDWTERLSRAWVVRGVALLLVVALLAPSAVSALTYEPSHTNLQKGTIEKPANGTTVISIQGFKFHGKANGKKPARLVGVGPRGNVKWIHNGSKYGITWFYDVDPMPNGHLFISSTKHVAGKADPTVVYEYNPETDERVWSKTFPNVHDTHDADLINNGTAILVANMRNYNQTTGRNDDRIFIYNRTQGKVTWQWLFRKHTNFTRKMGHDYAGPPGQNDWTHVNDVDKIGDGKYLISPRNMDQVMVIDRDTKNVVARLGSDNNYDILNEQHNPEFLRSENGTPTIVVADSHNDRVVEYEKRSNASGPATLAGPGHWVRTWKVGSHRSFNWPRDADRLPNGNTLIVDSNNNRVVEVTPQGRIVWEFYAPWAPYDVERVQLGDEGSRAGSLPTIADQGAQGSYRLSNSAGLSPGTGDRLTFSQWLTAAFAGTPLSGPVGEFANQWSKIAPWVRPVWMGPWDFVAAVLAVLLVAGWLLAELVYNRERITSGFRRRLA